MFINFFNDKFQQLDAASPFTVTSLSLHILIPVGQLLAAYCSSFATWFVLFICIYVPRQSNFFSESVQCTASWNNKGCEKTKQIYFFWIFSSIQISFWDIRMSLGPQIMMKHFAHIICVKDGAKWIFPNIWNFWQIHKCFLQNIAQLVSHLQMLSFVLKEQMELKMF